MREFQQSGFSLSGTAIRRHIGTLMLTLAVVVVGVFFVTRLPVNLLPSITYPQIEMEADAPGLSPEVAVDEITEPLEEALAATEGVVQVFSQTREGEVEIELFFEPGGDIDQALNDATASLNRARESLPDTISQPQLSKSEPSQSPVYELALTSPSLRGVDLRVFTEEELSRQLSIVPGVASVDVAGGVQEEVRINIDLNRLQSTGIGLVDVLSALEARNQDISGGRLRGGETESLTRTLGKFENADQIRNLSFTIPGSSPPRQVYLRNFAEIIDGTEEERVLVNLNREPAIKLSVQKQPEANTIEVVKGVEAKIAQLRESGLIPEDLVLTATTDESRFIENAISNVTNAGVIGACLAAVAVLLFLGSLRQTLVIVLAIPLATLAATILMGVFGLSLNVFSLGGLALGVGIVVDNSIVMLENVAKGTHQNGNGHRNGTQNGTPRSRNRQLIWQAEQSSRELESALLASTSTNLVAVLPFLLIGGFISLLFNELILTISFAVAASLAIALTVVPTLASRLLAVRWSSRVNQLGLLRAFNRRLAAATGRYASLLARVLQYRLLTIAIAFLVLGGSSLWMITQIPQEILPQISTGQARLFAQFPPGTPLASNRKVMAAVDNILLEQPETEYVFTTAGGYIFGRTTTESPLRGTSRITLKPGTNVPAFIDRVSQEFDRLNLVDTTIRISPGEVRGLTLSNSPVWAEIDLVLQGEDTQQLQKAGEQVLAALEDNTTLARFRPDAREQQPEVQIRPNWERVEDLALTLQEIGNTIQTAIQGSVPTQLERGDRLVDIQVQLAENSIQNPSQLEQLPLFVEGGRPIRLSDVAQVDSGQAPGEIQRLDQQQVFIIAGSLSEGASLSEALAEADEVIANLDLPEGVSRLPSAAGETNRQLQNSLITLGSLAAFLVFVAMAVQYNSLIDPLVIMLTVPLALAGGILGLFVTQTAIGATVIIGAILLVGIVVNNAIIMVELANQIRAQEKVDHRSAILKAAPQRLRPILMTTITTVLGLFPLALGIGEGSEFLQPLGIVTFSGLSLATLLTLFIIPCFYTLLHQPPRRLQGMTPIRAKVRH